MNCEIVENKKHCNCTYGSCERKGKCCECASYHLQNKELPACFLLKTTGHRRVVCSANATVRKWFLSTQNSTSPPILDLWNSVVSKSAEATFDRSFEKFIEENR